MRGKHDELINVQVKQRNIPAHAGKTAYPKRSWGRKQEHPRACGENAMVLIILLHLLGNIPAHAGKTVLSSQRASNCQEHPRACGENHVIEWDSGCAVGTSPRMRGKLSSNSAVGARRRNIPAHAGKTIRGQHGLQQREEHPRACGENCLPRSCAPHQGGTSPRMRGKHGGVFEPESGGRNIPAHAGKTVATRRCSLARWEHPRACGENYQRFYPPRGFLGTSPRMRGKQRWSTGLISWSGNIPAHAGKTFSTYRSIAKPKEHPRACGENPPRLVWCGRLKGTSPRMRGKQPGDGDSGN